MASVVSRLKTSAWLHFIFFFREGEEEEGGATAEILRCIICDARTGGWSNDVDFTRKRSATRLLHGLPLCLVGFILLLVGMVEAEGIL